MTTHGARPPISNIPTIRVAARQLANAWLLLLLLSKDSAKTLRHGLGAGDLPLGNVAELLVLAFSVGFVFFFAVAMATQIKNCRGCHSLAKLHI